MYKYFITLCALNSGIQGKILLKSEHIFEHDTNHINQTQLERGKLVIDRFDLTFPGTKWCGPGNTATNYDELGKHKEEDKCCRAHDHCDNIASGSTKYGLKNNDTFTRLHCQCDKEFRDCLKTIKSKVSEKIGTLYFYLRDKCYMEYYPILNCVKNDTRYLFLRRCVRYVFDTSQAIKYQWFDLPFFAPLSNTSSSNGDKGDGFFQSNRID